MRKKPKCDCHLYERQVCDICQGVTGNEKDKEDPPRLVVRGLYGYHTKQIKKGKLGTISKIQEELDELQDAEDQGVKILIACELADLYGALRDYAEKHGLQMEDLRDMVNLTKAAFEGGYR